MEYIDGQSADDVFLVARETNIVSLLPTTRFAPALNTLTALSTSTDSRVQSVLTQLGNLASSPAALQTAAKQLAPDVSGSTTQGAVNASTSVARVVGAHMVALASADGQTGVAAGDSLKGYGLWAQPFGFHADQGEQDEVNGFTANSGGLTVGADAKALEPLTVGIAFSYGHTWLSDTGDLSGDKTNFDNYQPTLYGIWQGTPWYVDAQFAYAFDHFDTTRAATVGTISETAKGSFDGHQWSAKLDGGYPIPVSGVVITPSAALAYTGLHQDGYTETGAPTLGLVVAPNDDHLLRSTLAINAAKTLMVDGGTLSPSLRLGWAHDFHAVAAISVAQFAFGGSSFTTTGATPARNTGIAGASLTFASLHRYSLAAEYDAEFKDDYVGQTGLLTARIDF
jgi:outer membrane autotransporter protein